MRILVLILFVFLFSCQKSKPSDTKVVKTNDIQVGPIRHESLSPALIERIKKVHGELYEVEGIPLDKSIENFKRDMNPEPNLVIWEQMGKAYTAYIAIHNSLSLREKKEVYRIILLRSMISTDEVLKRLELKYLSVEDSKKVMEHYPWKPVPITVAKQ